MTRSQPVDLNHYRPTNPETSPKPGHESPVMAALPPAAVTPDAVIYRLPQLVEVVDTWVRGG